MIESASTPGAAAGGGGGSADDEESPTARVGINPRTIEARSQRRPRLARRGEATGTSRFISIGTRERVGRAEPAETSRMFGLSGCLGNTVWL